MKKKIIFFIGSLSWGGAEKIITVLANSYLDRDYDVTIVTLLSNKNVFDLDKRIKLVSLTRENKSNIGNVRYWIKGIKHVVEVEKPDIVVSFVCRINLLVIKGLKKSKHKCRLIISERNDPRYDTRGTLARFLSKRMYKYAGVLICQTTEEKEWFNEKIKKKAIVIPNPVFLTAEPTQFDDKKKIIINAARYDQSKNQKMLIDAFKSIVDKKADDGFKLHFYGSGALKETLINYVKQLGLQDYVSIFDSVKDVQQKIADASIFCLTSNYEGMSNSLMEAVLLGTPSISTNTSGAHDLIKEGKNGYVVNVNDVESLVSCLTKLIQSEDTRKTMNRYCLSKEFQTTFANSLSDYIKYIDGNC